MRILVAPDKFKHSLGASEVAELIGNSLREILPTALIEICPIADGGEGTAECIQRARGGDWRRCSAHDALGREIVPRYLWLDDLPTAIIEMSEAAGLWRIAPNERAILRADTFGVGEMILDAAKDGAQKIIVGLGGSATNDGGFGMARSLGFSFRDGNEDEITRVAESKNLERLVRRKQNLPTIIGACDVGNPLLGVNAATKIFAKQKGASPGEAEILETALEKLASVAGKNFANVTGAGAAGGLGFGLLAFCGAELRSGFEIVSELLDLENSIRRADVVITGEGKLDQQTLAGKAPFGVAMLAKRFRKPVYAIVGQVSADAAVHKIFDGIFPVNDERNAKLMVSERARELAALLAR